MPTVPSADIYFETHGAGTPVMLVPGLGGVGSYWNPNIPAFAQKYHVVLHDHRGTGQSSRSRIHYTVDQMTDDLLAVMNHLEIEKAHLVGHSTGGAIGQTLAAKHPDRLINDNIGLLEERENVAIPGFPLAEIAASRIDAIVDFNRTADLPKIRTPTLVICAKDDFLTPPYFSRELARLIPGADFVELTRGGHCASETNTPEFNDAVLGFIARHS